MNASKNAVDRLTLLDRYSFGRANCPWHAPESSPLLEDLLGLLAFIDNHFTIASDNNSYTMIPFPNLALFVSFVTGE
jgi:hypothetical protein